MGHVYAPITLRNPRQPKLRAFHARALVDTGAMTLCIPQHVSQQLKLEQNSVRQITTADGAQHEVPYVGPIELHFEDRSCFVGALVLGDEVLLGAVPMEDMDLVVSPSRQTVTVNPASPNIPHAVVKGAVLSARPKRALK